MIKHTHDLVQTEHREQFLSLYRHMLTSRLLDQRETDLVSAGKAHFQVSSAGHEGSAVLQMHLDESDWLHCHYRDKALLLARGMSIRAFFDSLLCNATSQSSGRQLPGIHSDSRLKVACGVLPVGNHALHAVGVAAALKHRAADGRSIVICSMGDGTTQQGEVLEAIAEAVRSQLPVLFFVEDNKYSISTRTEKQTFFDLPHGSPEQFYGVPVHHLPGHDVLDCHGLLGDVIGKVRQARCPAIVVFHVERLTDHSNADDQSMYRDAAAIRDLARTACPITVLEEQLIDSGVPAKEFARIRQETEATIDEACTAALASASPTTIRTAKKPLPQHLATAVTDTEEGLSGDPKTMRDAIRDVLGGRMTSDPRVVLFGEDIEDPKGDVFGLTKGLSTQFPGRVRNSPLAEATIVGTSIGRAFAGDRPVAFIQFADFLPVAFNQVASELGTMWWRSAGDWECPVILIVTCGGYRPGLGPFHAQTLESIVAHCPGLDVFMPSTAADAAGLLNASFESERPTILFLPKICLNDRRLATSCDVRRKLTSIGASRFAQRGDHLTIVTWGSTTQLCDEAVEVLTSSGFAVDLVDLRSLSPWDKDAVVASVLRSKRLLVVHEAPRTCGFGAEVVSSVCEAVDRQIVVRRVTGADTYLPCNYDNHLDVLPSLRTILDAASDLLGFELRWEQQRLPEPVVDGLVFVEANAASPADQSLTVVEWAVAEGEEVEEGQLLVEVESDKAIYEIVAPVSGVVDKILVAADECVDIGVPLAQIRTGCDGTDVSNAMPPSRPIIRRTHDDSPGASPDVPAGPDGNGAHEPSHSRPAELQRSALRHSRPASEATLAPTRPVSTVYLGMPAVAVGSREITTEEIARKIPDWTPDEAIKRTGIRCRNWTAEGEDANTLSEDAVASLLDRLKGELPTISAIYCSVTFPSRATPSIACGVAAHLADLGCLAADYRAVDFNAACSGFIYGVGLAHEYLHAHPDATVLLITAEVLSPTTNPQDPGTAFLFGDAATASLITAVPRADSYCSILRPLLRATPDVDNALSSPNVGADGSIRMDGIALARKAYKVMGKVLTDAACNAGYSNDQLSYVVPHPGSQRILQNVGRYLKCEDHKLLSTLSHTGNTSSSSIPLSLHHYWNDLLLTPNGPLGLVAFGAGFTSAAAIAHMHGNPT